jgi:hypothetical protein
MSNLTAEHYSVVGITGHPCVECGRALPILRRNADGYSCSFSITERMHIWEPGDNYYSFPSPMPIPPSCVRDGLINEQPVAIYAGEELFAICGIMPPADWQTKDGYYMTCESDSVVAETMNSWATLISDSIDCYMRHNWGKDALAIEHLRHLFDVLLCAAKGSNPLRIKGHVGWMLWRSKERVEQYFERWVKPEFNTITEEQFLERVKEFGKQ